jgi:hypothetical protein
MDLTLRWLPNNVYIDLGAYPHNTPTKIPDWADAAVSQK